MPKSSSSVARLTDPSSGAPPSERGTPSATRDAELVATKALVTGDVATENIQFATREVLIAMQSSLLHGSEWGIWETPKRWAPMFKQSLLRVDLKARILALLPAEASAYRDLEPNPSSIDWVRLERALAIAVLQTTRYLVLCRVGPVGLRHAANESSDPSTLAQRAHQFLPMLAALCVSKWLERHTRASEAEAFFSLLSIEDLAHLSSRNRDALKVEMHRMAMLSEKALWFDAPKQSRIEVTTNPTGDKSPPTPDVERDPHQPFPDDWTGEMGHKCAWLIENLASSVIDVLGRLEELWNRAASTGAKPPTLTRWCQEYLSTYEWRDAAGQKLATLPFSLGLSRRGAKDDGGDALAWPPVNAAQIFGLAKTVQTAHLFIVGLSMGSRRSETLTLERNCVRRGRDGELYASGRTFKLVQWHDGEERDWVLPDLAAQAIEQQSRLVAAGERLSSSSQPRLSESMPTGTHLWGAFGGGSHDRTQRLGPDQMNRDLVTLAEALGMETRPGGQLVRSHRFRKTLARLAALAIVESPKVLLDVFGHKSLEMTLYYILEDKDLRAEIDTVARELRVMRATTVVSDMVAAEEARQVLTALDEPDTDGAILGGYGGRAAFTIHNAVKVERERVHRTGEAWGADDTHELAVMLTAQGSNWQTVRKGVLCTKNIGQVGPCNRKKGHPEPSRCNATCDFRLEENWHLDDVDASIAYAIEQYLDAGRKEFDLAQEMWRAQVLNHLPRFPSLKAKWTVHPTVKAMLAQEEFRGV